MLGNRIALMDSGTLKGIYQPEEFLASDHAEVKPYVEAFRMARRGARCPAESRFARACHVRSTIHFHHRHEVATLAAEHFWLVFISMLLATAIGVPLGILLTRRPKWKTLVLGANNVVQTIPSLALFGLLLPLPWLGVRADRLAIAALTLYALLPIVQNTYTGIVGIDASTREAASGMGLTSRQLLWHLELPLAFPVLSGRNPRGHRNHRGSGYDRSRHWSRWLGRVYFPRTGHGGQ